jgi:hypothetical protein
LPSSFSGPSRISRKGTLTSADLFSAPGRRLLPIAAAYVLVATAGATLSLVYDVGAEPGGDPVDDLAFRGTGLAPPMFLPIVLLAAAVLARAPRWPGVVGAVLIGLVGIGLLAGGTFNLPNDLDAARAAGSPTELTIAAGVVAAIFGLVFIALATAELVIRLRRRAVARK